MLLVFIVFGYLVASLWLLLMPSQGNSIQPDPIQQHHAFLEWLSIGFGWLVSNWLFCVVPFTWATSLRVSIKPFDAKASGDLLACFQEGAPNSLPPPLEGLPTITSPDIR